MTEMVLDATEMALDLCFAKDFPDELREKCEKLHFPRIIKWKCERNAIIRNSRNIAPVNANEMRESSFRVAFPVGKCIGKCQDDIFLTHFPGFGHRQQVNRLIHELVEEGGVRIEGHGRGARYLYVGPLVGGE